MNRAVPMINTARLTLRAMRPDDFDRFAQIWAMPGVVRHIDGSPRTRSQAWAMFLRNAGHWQMTGLGQWAIIEQRSRRMIGQTGFFYGGRDMGEDFDSFPEAGWVLVPRAHGNGFGQEAAKAAHDWFDRVVPGPVVAQISQDNAPSLALADRLGYRLMREISDETGMTALLRRDGPRLTA